MEKFSNLINYSKFNIFITKLLLYLFLYATFVILFLTYDITLSPDFEKYVNYFFYYDGQVNKTNLEQGNFYFYLTYVIGVVVKYFIPFLSPLEVVNLSVHFTNYLLVLFGFIGISNYLSLKKYEKIDIQLTLLSCVVLSPLIQMRLTLKPEILAFSLITWIFYYLEKFKSSKSKLYLLQTCVLIIILITSKISVAVISVIIIGYYIFKNHVYLISKKNLYIFVIFILCIFSLNYENYKINDKYFFQVEHEEKYNNKADLNFLINFDTENIIDNPNRYFFSNSFIGITLLDTFGDFFKLYWNSEYSELNLGRYNFFEIFDTNNNNTIPTFNFDKENFILKMSANFDERFDDINYVNETRQRASFKSAILYYFILLLTIFTKTPNKFIILSPFIGIILIILSALGLFTNNFDPKIGDSVKTFYYGFLIVISLIFLLVEIFQRFVNLKGIMVFIILFFSLFNLGFPFNFSDKLTTGLYYKNSLLPTCEFNNIFIWKILNIPDNNFCKNEINSNNYKFEYIPIKNIENISFKLNFQNTPFLHIIIILFLTLNTFYIFRLNLGIKNE